MTTKTKSLAGERTQIIYGAPRFATSHGRPVYYVDEIHNVYRDDVCVDSYKYAHLAFSAAGEAHRFVAANGGKFSEEPIAEGRAE